MESSILIIAASDEQQNWLHQLARQVCARPVVIALGWHEVQLLSRAYSLVLVDLDGSNEAERHVLQKRLRQAQLQPHTLVFTSTLEDCGVLHWLRALNAQGCLLKTQPPAELSQALQRYQKRASASTAEQIQLNL